jgi:pimeloyl-ACP methyl ester carboxylesterase
VTTLWADERIYYPLHAQPYTPAHHFPKGKNDPGFRTKPRIAAELAGRLPYARHVSLDWAGHLPNLERPAAFNALLVEFLGAGGVSMADRP